MNWIGDVLMKWTRSEIRKRVMEELRMEMQGKHWKQQSHTGKK